MRLAAYSRIKGLNASVLRNRRVLSAMPALSGDGHWYNIMGMAIHGRKESEQELQMAVMRYLTLACPDVFSLHIPNGGYRRKAEAAIMKGMGVKAGVSDILLLWKPGKCGFIELKTPKAKNRLSDHQHDFMQRMKGFGVPIAVATSVDEVRKIVVEWNIPCRETRL